MKSNIVTLAALINGMIGTSLLLLPILYVRAGLINSIVITLITGLANLYAGRLTYRHSHVSEDQYSVTMNRHYKKKLFSFYDLLSSIADQLTYYIFLNILISQWSGIFYKYQKFLEFLPYIVCFTLYLWTVLFIKYKIELNLMAFGITSIAIYFGFILWVLFTKPIISQTGKNFQLMTPDIGALAGTISVAISIQTIFIPMLRKNADVASNNKLLVIGYMFGTFFYIAIGVIGGYGIVGRVPFFKDAQLITLYFIPNTIGPLLIQILQFIHIYSICPELVIIQKQKFVLNRNRMIHLLNIQFNEVNQMTYIILTHVIGCGFYVLNIKLDTMLSISGGIIYFFIIYLIPSCVHIKCLYYSQIQQIQHQPYLSLNQQQYLIYLGNKYKSIMKIQSLNAMKSVKIIWDGRYMTKYLYPYYLYSVFSYQDGPYMYKQSKDFFFDDSIN